MRRPYPETRLLSFPATWDVGHFDFGKANNRGCSRFSISRQKWTRLSRGVGAAVTVFRNAGRLGRRGQLVIRPSEKARRGGGSAPLCESNKLVFRREVRRKEYIAYINVPAEASVPSCTQKFSR